MGIDVSTLIADRGDICQRPNPRVSAYRGIIMADPQVLSTLRRRQADMENAIAAYERNGRRDAGALPSMPLSASPRPKSGLNMCAAVQAWRSGCVAQWILVEASAYTVPEHALV